MKNSIAHRFDMNNLGQSLYPDGTVPWSKESTPKLTGKLGERTTGRLRSCSYCGSMHPSDIAKAIQEGAKGSWADFKYGWPHKAYFDDIPNPFEGMLESRSSANFKSKEDWVQVGKTGWREPGSPAPSKTSGKFYTIHLQDATPEEREIIQAHLGLEFDFTNDGKVRWCPYEKKTETRSNV